MKLHLDDTGLHVRVDDADGLAHAHAETLVNLAPRVPVWIVYAKGPARPFGERAVRAFMRDAGYADTKVASVSPRLTALRFTRPHKPK